MIENIIVPRRGAQYSQVGDRIFFNYEVQDPVDSESRFELYTFELRQPQASDADINGAGTVGFADFLILAANFSKTDASIDEGDIDGDSQVTFRDFLVLSNAFGKLASS